MEKLILNAASLDWIQRLGQSAATNCNYFENACKSRMGRIFLPGRCRDVNSSVEHSVETMSRLGASLVSPQRPKSAVNHERLEIVKSATAPRKPTWSSIIFLSPCDASTIGAVVLGVFSLQTRLYECGWAPGRRYRRALSNSE
jgi:hypothetical protein